MEKGGSSRVVPDSDVSESLDSGRGQGQRWNSGTDRHNCLCVLLLNDVNV